MLAIGKPGRRPGKRRGGLPNGKTAARQQTGRRKSRILRPRAEAARRPHCVFARGKRATAGGCASQRSDHCRAAAGDGKVASAGCGRRLCAESRGGYWTETGRRLGGAGLRAHRGVQNPQPRAPGGVSRYLGAGSFGGGPGGDRGEVSAGGKIGRGVQFAARRLLRGVLAVPPERAAEGAERAGGEPGNGDQGQVRRGGGSGGRGAGAGAGRGGHDVGLHATGGRLSGGARVETEETAEGSRGEGAAWGRRRGRHEPHNHGGPAVGERPAAIHANADEVARIFERRPTFQVEYF
mmetsp:Transcript_6203/g.15391  ORF Transcript_6203/g.15391 Transcript_6203/m.15391 type:complete len:294 (+) Transcript_6203:320-1201(+)